MNVLTDCENNDRVDASVLFKALQETTARYPKFNLVPPAVEYLQKKWKDAADTFCDLTERVAVRNCPARDDAQKLIEEELFLGTLGTSQRLDYGDSDLMHRARIQVSEIVRTLRREIKDLKPQDEEDEDSSDGEAFISPRIAQQMETRQAILERLRSRPIYKDNEAISDGTEESHAESDDDVVEIPRPANFGARTDQDAVLSSEDLTAKKEVIEIADTDSDSGHSAESSIVEVEAPDREDVIIKRAFNACQYALRRLSDDNIVPYGLRLFAYVALDVLLTTIRRKTALSNIPEDGVDAQANVEV